MAVATRVPAIVKTALVPTKNAATSAVLADVPVTGPNAAASIAAPAPTEAGANGTSRPPPWAKTTSRIAAGVAGGPNAAREQPSAASRHRRLSACQGATRQAKAAGERAPQPRATRAHVR